MARKKIQFGTAIDADLHEEVEAWIKKESARAPMTKVWVIETALREFLKKRESNDD